MRGILFTGILASLMTPFWGCSSCSKHGQVRDGDEEALLDVAAEVDGTMDPELDHELDEFDPEEDIPADPEAEDEPLPDVPNCGNGELDEGEECDDRNRLNGDGCDWLCRLGDGEPPLDPGPYQRRYLPDGSPVQLTGIEPITPIPIPLVWTGSQLAAVFYESEPTRVHFTRFSSSGTPLGTDWVYESTSALFGSALLWTGSEFALFYGDTDVGIYLIILDSDGVPTGDPVLVVDDPLARTPSADVTDDGYVIVWLTDASDPGVNLAICSADGPQTAKIQRLGPDGSTIGFPGPATFSSTADSYPAVASGESGFGIQVGDYLPGLCATRFIHVSEDLTSVTYSGFLGLGPGQDMVHHDGEFLVPFLHSDGIGTCEVCIAHFTEYGVLDRPPVRNFVYESGAGINVHWPPGVVSAFGDGGLSAIFSGVVPLGSPDYSRYLVRTDALGTAIDPPVEAYCCIRNGIGAFNIVWTGSDFKVVVTGRDSMSGLQAAYLVTLSSAD